MAKEMPILKALRKLIIPQFIKPEWIIWKNSSKTFGEWEFQPDGFCNEHSLTINFNHFGGSVRVSIENEYGKSQYFNIPWADPECDTKVVKLLKDWFVMLWLEGNLDAAGYPNPSVGGERPNS